MIKYIMNKVKKPITGVAEDHYKQIRNAILELSRKKEFETVINWWVAEYTKLDDEVAKASPENVYLLVKEREIIKKHLLWLETMTQEIDR